MEDIGRKGGLLSSSVFNMGRKGASLGRTALSSVVNIHQQINPSGLIPASPMRASKEVGMNIIGGIMGSSSHESPRPSLHLVSPISQTRTAEEVLDELGLYKDESELERLAIFYQFTKSCDGSSSCTAGANTDSEDQSEDLEIKSMTIEKFVMDMRKRGQDLLWCDAAYRAFSSHGLMNKYEYAVAVKALETSEKNMKNPTWLELRRYLVFIYYDRSSQKSWSQENFYDYLADFSASEDGKPEAFGVSNQAMLKVPESVYKGAEQADDNTTLVQAFATCKVELAIQRSEYDALTLSYLKLEKQLCASKLKMAKMQEILEGAGYGAMFDEE